MRVECIIHFPRRSNCPNENIPINGGIYTVRSRRTVGGITGYLLNEIINEPQIYSDSGGVALECGFDVKGFRPITDISALTKLTKVKELEDA